MKSLNNRAIQSRTATAVRLCPPAAVAPSYKPTHVSPCTQPQVLHAISLGLSRQQQQQHMQQLQQQRWSPLQPAQAASSDSSSSNSDGSASNSSSGSQPQQKLNWFDRLSQKTQLMIMGGLLFVALIGVPFLQPTFLYGDGSMGNSKPGSGQITDVIDANAKRELPQYIPVASELYSFLQDNCMPTTLPDGRTESPGVLRIYLASMVILAVFYLCSAVLGLILKSVATILRAVGIMGPPPPPKPEDQQGLFGSFDVDVCNK